eukprot:GHVU01029517.1.p1 GENE.GHVU01029517.1~~GHVU01029517.1.p1  ORF type:complete len:282 (+),score=55.18 GHVU01029517.1:55-846(+)
MTATAAAAAGSAPTEQVTPSSTIATPPPAIAAAAAGGAAATGRGTGAAAGQMAAAGVSAASPSAMDTGGGGLPSLQGGTPDLGHGAADAKAAGGGSAFPSGIGAEGSASEALPGVSPLMCESLGKGGEDWEAAWRGVNEAVNRAASSHAVTTGFADALCAANDALEGRLERAKRKLPRSFSSADTGYPHKAKRALNIALNVAAPWRQAAAELERWQEQMNGLLEGAEMEAAAVFGTAASGVGDAATSSGGASLQPAAVVAAGN